MQIARSWRQQPTNLRLIGSHCPSCGALDFTLVYEAPRGFAEQVPYLAALVRLEEGPMVATMLTDVDPEDVAVGMPVTMVTRRISADGDSGPIMYGYKFAPVCEVSP